MSLTTPDSSSPPLQCTVDGTSPSEMPLFTGPQLFGNNAAWFLLGFLFVQTYAYYTRSGRDRPIFKTLVYVVAFIAMGETAAESFTDYTLLGLGWGDRFELKMPHLGDADPILADLQPLFDALPALFVQFYFTWRIWTFCMAFGGRAVRVIVASICAFLILTSMCAVISCIILTILLLVYRNADAFPYATVVLVIVWTVSTAVADLTITICMMAILYHAKSSSCFGETRDRISRLLRLTIQTGFLTSILALPIAPLFSLQQGGIYTLPCFLLGKSYVISLLANLNARTYRPSPTLTEETGANDPAAPQFSTMIFTPGQNPGSNGANTTPSNGVFSFIRSITRTTHNEPSHPIPLSTGYMSRPGAEVQPVGDLAGSLHDSGETSNGTDM